MHGRALHMRAGALGLALLCATYVACTVTYGTEPGGLPDAGDAGPGVPDVGIVDSGVPEADAGQLLYKVPGRPSSEDETGQDLKLLFAMDWLALGPRPQDTAITEDQMSFDLDGVATCPEQPSCVAPMGSEPQFACDGPGGRDNGMFRMLKRLNADTQQFGVNTGGPSFLVGIEGYNGGLNDRQVTVRMYTSLGTQTPLADGGGADPDGGQPTPKLDGNDYWRIDQKQLQNTPPVGTQCSQPSDPCTTSVKDTTAYVANGQLVSVFDIPLLFTEYGPKVQLDLRSGFLTAKVQQRDGGAWSLEDGQLVGRASIESVVRVFGVFNDAFSPGKPYCQVPGDFATIRKIVCDARDIAADRTKDGKGETCSGISSNFMFHAKPARLGTVISVTPGVEPCPEGTVYTCE